MLMAAIEFVGVGCQVGLGAMFLWSGAAKLWDVAPFQSTIRSLGLSPQVASTSAATVIIAELVLGMFATTGWVPIPTSVGIALLLLLFAGVAVYAKWASLTVTCNCFGASRSRFGREDHYSVSIAPVTGGISLLAHHYATAARGIRRRLSRGSRPTPLLLSIGSDRPLQRQSLADFLLLGRC